MAFLKFLRVSLPMSGEEVKDAPLADVISKREGDVTWTFREIAFGFGFLAMVRGIGYWPTMHPDQIPGGVASIAGFIPLTAWAFGWYIAGLGAWVGVALNKSFAGAGVAAMSAAWAFGYTMSWLNAGPNNLVAQRDFLGASIYAVVSWTCVKGRRLVDLARPVLINRGTAAGGDA